MSNAEMFPMRDGPAIPMETAKRIHAIGVEVFGDLTPTFETLVEQGGISWDGVGVISRAYEYKFGKRANW
jgi:hypothetical protein